jgi:hypothetical protein
MDLLIEELKNAIKYAKAQESQAIPVTLEWLEVILEAVEEQKKGASC